MAWPINSSRYDPKSPGSTDLFSDIIGQITVHDGLLSGIQQASNCPLVPNGSFELDANLTVTPTGWTPSALTGGSGYVSTSDSSHGSRCYMAIHPGGALNGGMTLTTTEALPVSIGQAFTLFFDAYSTNATVRIKADVIWYDKDGAQIGATQNVVDEDGSIPGTWNTYNASLTPYMTPSAAKYMKIIITLGAVGTDPGSSTNIFLDNVVLAFRRLFSNQVVITSSQIWTVPAGVTKVKFQLVGAGGDGTGSTSTFAVRNGGGAGYTEAFVDVQPGQDIDIHVGLFSSYGDGDSSRVLGMTAGGGKSNGTGGTASGGTINLTGQDGNIGYSSNDAHLIPALCGAGWFGGYGSGYTPWRRGSDGVVIITY